MGFSGPQGVGCAHLSYTEKGRYNLWGFIQLITIVFVLKTGSAI